MTGAELIAAYVLGELDGPELADFERRLAAEPALRAEVEATRGTMASIEALPAHAWPGEDPVATALGDGERVHGTADRSARDVERVNGAADPSTRDAEPVDGTADRLTRDEPVVGATAGRFAPRAGGPAHGARSRSRGGRLSLRPALAAAALLAVFVVGGVVGALIFSGGGSSSPPAKTVLVLHPLDAPKGSRADISMPAADTMLLRAHGLPASPAGSYYEVWLMSNGRKLVPVASFRVGGSGEASVEVPLPAAPTDYRYFDVSRQTVAGGTGHSADSVLRGSTGGLS